MTDFAIFAEKKSLLLHGGNVVVISAIKKHKFASRVVKDIVENDDNFIFIHIHLIF